MADLLAGLNDKQRAAAEALDGPILILAGAGSGKTRTITHRAAHLVANHQVAPEQLLVVTFTNRAAGELRERLDVLLGEDQSKKVWAMTFHAVCLRILRRSGPAIGIPADFTILDAGDSRKLINQAAADLEDPAREDKDELGKIRAIISRAKNAGHGPDDLSGNLGIRAAMIWKRYSELCKSTNSLDFDDLLLQGVKALQSEHGKKTWGTRFAYVMVDEYQDVNNAQEQLLHGLCDQTQNICVVGDDSQCLTGEALVSMADGSKKPIRDITPGERVLSSYGHQGIKYSVVSAISKRQASCLVRISLADGRSLISTPEHTHFVLADDLEQSPCIGELVLCDDGPQHALRFQGLSLEQAMDAENGHFPARQQSDDGNWVLENRSASVHVLLASADRVAKQIRTPGLELKHTFIAHTGETMSFIAASDIKPGMHMMTQDGAQQVVLVDHLDQAETVYDLNITDTHNFFANQICTHNSVYAFRGAQVEHILRFREGWSNAQVYKLEENYRSSAAILRAAQSVIDGSHHKSDKRLVARLPEGAPVRLLRFANHWDEAAFVADRVKQLVGGGVKPEDIAISYRTNAQSQALEEALTERGMDYHVVGGVGFTRRVEVQGARAYMALLSNPRDRMALERLSGFPKRGIGPAALQAVFAQPGDNLVDQMRLAVHNPPKGVNSKAIAGLTELVHLFVKAQERAETNSIGELLHWMINASGMVAYLKKQGERGRDQLENLDGLVELAERYDGNVKDNLIDWVADTALHEQQKDEAPTGARLMSLHASKGLEFPYFFIVGLEEQLFLRGNVDKRGLDEERRLLYVGMTRAEKELVMTFADVRRLWGRELHTQPLQFLFDLPADVVRQRARTKASEKPSRPGRPSRPPYQKKKNTPAAKPERRQEHTRRAALAPPIKPKADKSVSTNQFRVGMQVAHKKFGNGQIVEVTPDLVKVRFADKVRALQVQYAGLQILS